MLEGDPSFPPLYPSFFFFHGERGVGEGAGVRGVRVWFHFTTGASAKCSLRSCASAAALPAFSAFQPRPPPRLSPPLTDSPARPRTL